jgi:hypothetical protein
MSYSPISSTFQRNALSPSSGSKSESSKKQIIHPLSLLASCMAYSLTLKKEVVHSSEISVNSCQITWRYIPKDGILHSHHCENLKSKVSVHVSNKWNISVHIIVHWNPNLYCFNFCPFIAAFLAHGDHINHIIVPRNVSLTIILCLSWSSCAKVDKETCQWHTDCCAATCQWFNTIIYIIMLFICCNFFKCCIFLLINTISCDLLRFHIHDIGVVDCISGILVIILWKIIFQFLSF